MVAVGWDKEDLYVALQLGDERRVRVVDGGIIEQEDVESVDQTQAVGVAHKHHVAARRHETVCSVGALSIPEKSQ